MSAISSAMGATALHLLSEYGQSATFRRVTEGAYDPNTGTTAAASTDDETVLAALIRYKDHLVDGANIQRGDRKAVIAALDSNGDALGKTPQVQDQIITSETFNVVAVQTIEASGTAVAYICQVRN